MDSSNLFIAAWRSALSLAGAVVACGRVLDLCPTGVDVQAPRIARPSNRHTPFRSFVFMDILRSCSRELSNLFCGEGSDDRNAEFAVAVGLVHKEEPEQEQAERNDQAHGNQSE